MIDSEVERLRRLRGSALRLRAVARALGGNEWTLDDPLLSRGACAAWRIARAVSGRLRAHPYANFQKGPSLALLVSNSVAAKVAAGSASNRVRTLANFEAQLKILARAVDDARALTRICELSDSFGRSQKEIRSLIAAVECETRETGEPIARRSLEPQRQPASIVPKASGRGAAAVDGDWPYLAF